MALDSGPGSLDRPPTHLAPLPRIVRAPKVDPAQDGLPPQLTSFIGRERELADLGLLLETARLVTLTGPAGIGKTRLALQVAAQHQPEYSDGVSFVELAPIQDPIQVTQAVAAVLQVHEENGQSLIETIKKRLRPQRRLLILDNCEHLLSACATVAETLLATAPAVRIITTSREALRIGAEHVWRVAPLSLPDSSRPIATDGVEHFEAISLFVDRARAAEPAFSLTRDNAYAVVELCRHLDGIPLAIELAAACSDFLSPLQMLGRLGDRFTILSSGSRTAPPRQQSLARAIEWSCDLLTDSERRIFSRSSIFVGAFTPEAAAAVCRGEQFDAAEVLELVGRLVRKSLIVAEPDRPGRLRYRLLETVRAYAAHLLRASGEWEQVAEQHASFYVALARRSQYEAAPAAWAQELNQQYDDLDAVLCWLIDNGDVQEAHLVGSALSQVWRQRGLVSKGRTTLANLLELPGAHEPTRARANLLLVSGSLALYQGDLSVARNFLEECVSTIHCLEETRELPMAFGYLADIDVARGDSDAARLHLEAGLAASRRVADDWSEATLQVRLAQVQSEQGDSEAAAELAARALPVLRARGAKRVLAMGLQVLANSAARQHDHVAARRLLEEALANWNAVAGLKGAAWALLDLGRLALTEGNDAVAAAQFSESLATCREVGDRWGVVLGLEGFVTLAARAGRAELAVRLAGAASAIRESAQVEPSTSQATRLAEELAGARRLLSKARYSAAWKAGRAMSSEDAVELAIGHRENAPQAHLTSRERQVVQLVARGWTNHQIAEALVIDQRTAEGHVSRILARLGLRRRAEIAAWAVQNGLAMSAVPDISA